MTNRLTTFLATLNPLTYLHKYLVKQINKRLTYYVKGDQFKEFVLDHCDSTFLKDLAFRKECTERIIQNSEDYVKESIDDYVNANVSACDIAENFDVSEIAECFSAKDVAEYLSFDASDIASHIDCEDVAGYIDNSEVAGYVEVEYSDLADHIEASDVAEHIDVDEGLNYDRLADKLVSKIAQSLAYTS